MKEANTKERKKEKRKRERERERERKRETETENNLIRNLFKMYIQTFSIDNVKLLYSSRAEKKIPTLLFLGRDNCVLYINLLQIAYNFLFYNL